MKVHILDQILNNRKRILVTGGAGFIGGALIRKLLSDSSAKIFNLDKFGYASNQDSINKKINLLGQSALERYKVLKLNLANFDQVNQAIKIAKPDLIFHLAAESHVDRSIDSPYEFISSNILGTFNLLESVRTFWNELPLKRKEIFRFHHISTDEVYGTLGNEGKFSELSTYRPNSPYSATKASSDHLVNAWHQTYGIPTVITNCSNNFGPWQYPEKLIPLAIFNALHEKKIRIYGDGQNVRDWLYVEDHVDGLLIAANKGKVGKSYCIGGFGETTNKDVVLKICKLLNKLSPNKTDYETQIEYVEDRPGHDKRYAIDSDLIQKELGWIPNNSFEESLEITVKWYIENQDWCEKLFLKSGYFGERVGLKNNQNYKN